MNHRTNDEPVLLHDERGVLSPENRGGHGDRRRGGRRVPILLSANFIRLLAVALVAFIALHIYVAYAVAADARSVLTQLETVARTDAASYKAWAEAVSVSIENQRKALLGNVLLANLTTVLGFGITLAGAWVAWATYLNVRRKERLDRAAAELSKAWEGLASMRETEMAAAVALLYHFIVDQDGDFCDEFHPRVVSALAFAARQGAASELVRRTLTPIVELAFRVLPPQVIRAVSWQQAALHLPNFRGANLDGIDFRDAKLTGADFSDATLTGARFDAAVLVESRFDKARMDAASLEHADLARASFDGAVLCGADLRQVKLLGADFRNADMTGARFAEQATDWRLARNWRDAKMEPEYMTRLLARYGKRVEGPRVLMLMWEFPPLVSGGGWTAGYHLITKLRSTGANITLLVPWASKLLDPFVFGSEVELISAEVQTPPELVAHFHFASNYSGPPPQGASLYFMTYNAAYTGLGSIMARVNEFSEKAFDLIVDGRYQFDVIHAHDWLTFKAAEQIAARLEVPFVAHFHSLEIDRRSNRADSIVTDVEQAACVSAAKIVVPSQVTANAVQAEYGVSSEKVVVIPNCFSDVPVQVPRLAEFNPGRIVFFGRVSQQKGPDLFVKFAERLRKRRPQTEFVMHGRGEQERVIAALIERLGPMEPFAMPAQDEKVERWTTDFEEMALINFDETTKAISRVIRISDPTDRFLREAALRKSGYTALPVQMHEPFTHRVWAAVSDGARPQYYLVKTRRFPEYRECADRFVTMNGFLAWEQRGDALRGASLVVVPSRSEPFGMAIVEAMLHGVPVMAPRDAGACEHIHPALEFDREDLQASAEAAASLLSDAAAWRAGSDQQLEEASKYCLEPIEDNVAVLWRDLASTAKRSSG